MTPAHYKVTRDARRDGAVFTDGLQRVHLLPEEAIELNGAEACPLSKCPHLDVFHRRVMGELECDVSDCECEA
jgi:hypothetical protein